MTTVAFPDSALHQHIHQQQQQGVDIRSTVELLRRYIEIERACIRATAGWFLAVPAYEDKIVLGYHLWGHAQRVEVLGNRMLEMRGGHSGANMEPMLIALCRKLDQAPDAHAFLAGIHGVLQRLADTYTQHLQLTDRSANASERRLLKHLLLDLQEQLDWHQQRESISDPTSQQWTDYLLQLLDAAGGISGYQARGDVTMSHPTQAIFTRPQRIVFDARIKDGDLMTYQDRLSQDFDAVRIGEFRVFFNEFYAASLLAGIIVDAWDSDVPWAFIYDMCHHCWDEVRHAEFGMIRLRELGVEPSMVNQSLFVASQSMPFLHRLCYLTLGLEVYFMPRKQPRVKRYKEAGDPRSQLFADVDWSDEGQHVQYGKRWVSHFLKEDARTVEHLQTEIALMLKQNGINLPDGELAPY